MIDTAQHSFVVASRKYPAAEKVGPESSATTKPARPSSVTTSACCVGTTEVQLGEAEVMLACGCCI